jgi:hypothetical protein
MKLFVWDGDADGYKHNVLPEFAQGIIVALAPDLESALAMIRTDQERVHAEYLEKTKHLDPAKSPCTFMEDFKGDEPSEVIDLGPVQSEPRYWFRRGSS